ncbi:MAG TPA: sulfotransferase family 2 domain-containing protein [Paracoccaceae bacterium]|nr:sulfotransferase family 2 domain-containing protein [Paracoccaceae bacterium]
MIISPQRNFIFIHIRKTAGTAVTRAYDKVALFDDIILGSTAHGDRVLEHYRDRYGLTKHSMLMDLPRVMGLDRVDNAFSFATVRNPWSWIVSYYTGAQKGQGERKILEATQASDFSGFLRSAVVAELARRAPQYRYVCDERGDLAVDLLIRQETLGEDWAELCDRLHISGVSLGVENRQTEGDWREFYRSKEDIALVGELFARDAEIFGYRFE